MKQRKYQLIILIALSSLLMLWSCKKEDVNIDITSTKWVVVKIKKQGEASFTKTTESYILEFADETTYTLKLDVNNCFGHYEIINNGNIKINAMGCTEICCDSDFAEDLSQLLPKMTKYYEKGNELIFEGEGEIILEKK